MRNNVKCGFLGTYLEPGHVARGAIEQDRKEACHPGLTGGVETANFYCHLNCVEFPTINTSTRKEIVPLIDTDVKCGKWRKWWPSKSPKEHEDMTILEQVKAEYAQQRKDDRLHGWRMAAFTAVVALIAAIIGGLLSRSSF